MRVYVPKQPGTHRTRPVTETAAKLPSARDRDRDERKRHSSRMTYRNQDWRAGRGDTDWKCWMGRVQTETTEKYANSGLRAVVRANWSQLRDGMNGPSSSVAEF